MLLNSRKTGLQLSALKRQLSSATLLFSNFSNENLQSSSTFIRTELHLFVMLSLLLTVPTAVLAGAGHDHGGGSEFQGTGEPTGAIEVDAQTAKQLGIKVEPAHRQQLAIGIKTTGQIETLPSKKVEVTTPIEDVRQWHGVSRY